MAAAPPKRGAGGPQSLPRGQAARSVTTAVGLGNSAVRTLPVAEVAETAANRLARRGERRMKPYAPTLLTFAFLLTGAPTLCGREQDVYTLRGHTGPVWC